MQREFHRWHTGRLGREMGLVVYGHWGTPLLTFPTSGGDEWEMDRMGMVDAIADHLEAGRVKLFCVGSNADQSFFNRGAHPFHRSWMQRMWDEYIRWEVIPFIHSHCQGLVPVATLGMSLGAYHAANTCFKHPDAVRACFALSGMYDLRRFMDGQSDENFYYNNPIDYIGGIDDYRLISQIGSCDIHIGTGHGPWEHPSHSYDLSRALGFKGINHYLDDWGPMGGHDWPYWKHMVWEYVKGF
jgi:esterase/lipase superfamily enzyme